MRTITILLGMYAVISGIVSLITDNDNTWLGRMVAFLVTVAGACTIYFGKVALL